MAQIKLNTIDWKFGGLLFAVILFQLCWADIDNNEVGDIPEFQMIQGVKVYQGDRQCVLVGGLCVDSSDCIEPTTTRGLCPTNSHRGVECCYELPIKPAPCQQHQGECMDRCRKTLMRPGTDCKNGQVCCVLV